MCSSMPYPQCDPLIIFIKQRWYSLDFFQVLSTWNLYYMYCRSHPIKALIENAHQAFFCNTWFVSMLQSLRKKSNNICELIFLHRAIYIRKSTYKIYLLHDVQLNLCFLATVFSLKKQDSIIWWNFSVWYLHLHHYHSRLGQYVILFYLLSSHVNTTNKQEARAT